MDELRETMEWINNEFHDINALLAARSRELDRREQWDEEIGEMIQEIKNNMFKINAYGNQLIST